MTKDRRRLTTRRPWSEAEIEQLRALYPDMKTSLVAQALGREIGATYQKALAIGLRKSEAHLKREAAGRIQAGRLNEAMRASQFKPGQQAWNKGLDGFGTWEACRATQFKKGRPANEARNYAPIGSHRVAKDGYLERKVSDAGPVRWVAEHRLVWESTHGPVPAGFVVIFKPGRKTTVAADITADGLECLSRQDLMRRNSVHTQYPPELARLVILRGAINRQINRRAKEKA